MRILQSKSRKEYPLPGLSLPFHKGYSFLLLLCKIRNAKVEKNIPYEKGVKDLKVDMKTQTITVTFREDKNTTENLQKAIEKLNIEVKGIEGNNTSAKTQTGEKCEKSCCEKEGKTK